MSDLIVHLLSVPALIALSAFFVVAEYALVALRNSQIETLRASRPGIAHTLAYLKANMTGAIGTTQVGITMSNLMLGSIGEPAMTDFFAHLFSLGGNIAHHPAFRAFSMSFSFVIVTLLTVVLAELVPKAVTLQYVVTCAILVARPIAFLNRICWPLVKVMTALANLTTRSMGLGNVEIGEEAASKEEIFHIASESAGAGNLTPRERQLVLNSLTLGRRTATEVMIPRVRSSFLDLQRSMADNQRTIGEYLYSRMPLCDGGMDHVVGVIYTKEFLTASTEVDDSSVLLLIARPPVFVPVTIALDKLLQRFHDDKTHLVFLVDEHGGVQGIVTLTDVVNEIVGHMNEDGEDDRILLTTADGYIIKGASPISYLAEHLGRPNWAKHAEVRTVGGLLVSELGRMPRTGDYVIIDHVKLIAHKTNGRSVDQVHVIPLKTEHPV